MTKATTATYELREKDFRDISSMVYASCRINLKEGKEKLVTARLSKRMRSLGISSFRDYIELVKENDREYMNMVDSLSTNLTSFFRESKHFDYLRTQVIPRFVQNGDGSLRMWSAGCSSGEEAYTLAITLMENIENIQFKDCKILATDISTRMLDAARNGEYPADRFNNVPADIKHKYFERIQRAGNDFFRVGQKVKCLIKFNYLNLMNPWPMTAKFDVIMCRNVMIYFDSRTQQELVNRFSRQLKPGGILMIGHSESLLSIDTDLQFVESATYRKPYRSC